MEYLATLLADPLTGVILLFGSTEGKTGEGRFDFFVYNYDPNLLPLIIVKDTFDRTIIAE